MSATDEPKPPSLSVLARGNNMITVNVGAEHEKYRIYADLIAFYSDYFKGTLNGPWKEAEDRVIKLPDIEPRVFDIFIDWLYTQKLPTKTRDWIAPTPKLEAGSHGHGQLAERLMMKSYVFADRFLVPQFRVAIYKYYANFCNSGGNPPYYDAIIYAFDNLPPTSAMLTLLVRTHCAYWSENSDTTDNGELELRQDLPHDFFFRAMAISSKMKDKSKAKGIACCDCHNETAITEREGCDTCMPLPEVKEETDAAEGEAQADATQTDGIDQATQANVPTANNNDDQTDQNAVQEDQNGGNDPTHQTAGQAHQTDGNDQSSQDVDQTDQNDGSDQTTQAVDQGDHAGEDVHDGEQFDANVAEAAIDLRDTSVHEEGASSAGSSIGVINHSRVVHSSVANTAASSSSLVQVDDEREHGYNEH